MTNDQKQQFIKEGYIIVKGLFTEEQLQEIDHTFEHISNNPVPGYYEPDMSPNVNDPLKRYPRVMHPHRFNDVAKKYLLHQPVEDALAAQSMFYYKPPGSRGQALHQDNFYLKVESGNCIAVWTAVDAADEEYGGLLVVPKTNHSGIVCPESADVNESYTTHYVKPPKDQKVVPARIDRGDVLFFNGNLIHGSYRNKTKDRFRRAFICHYANESATKIAGYYKPLLRANGSPADIESSNDGGPCGIEQGGPFYH